MRLPKSLRPPVASYYVECYPPLLRSHSSIVCLYLCSPLLHGYFLWLDKAC